VKEITSDKIRNFALVGHGGSGKTSLSEAIIFSMGEKNRIGTINDGTTTSDYHPDEIERKISISTSLLHGFWKDWKMNLLDAPGYSDFIGETKEALRVADLSVVVINGVEGVEVGTEQVIGFANEYKTPLLFFINRINSEHADFDKVLKTAQQIYGNNVVACSFPVNQGEGFNKMIDLLSMKLITFSADSSGKSETSEIPDDIKPRAEELRNKLIEAAAESDDALMEAYFDAGTLNDNQLKDGLRRGILNRTIIPVLCGAADTNYGTHLLLDFIGNYCPSPLDFKVIKGKKLGADESIERKVSSDEPLSSIIFKTISEAHVGELSLIRLYSGKITSGEEVLNATQQRNEKIGQIFLLNGKNRKEIGVLQAGDIGALVKLKNTTTGDTLCDRRDPIILESIDFPDPIISVAVKPKSRGDEEKISNGLHILHNEDPSFSVVNDPELKQTIISGQGELHLTVVIKRLKERFGVDVVEERPKIPYRETITSKSDDKYRHKKQTGGAGQFAEVWMKVEPMPKGGGFEFVNEVKGGAISSVFIPSIEKGVKNVLEAGPLAGYKVVDVKAIVYDGKEHPVDSKDIAFQTAGREVFKRCFLKANPILLEPIYDVEVKVPEEVMGDVMGDLSGRRGKILGSEVSGHFQIIKAKVPLSELDRYATTLRSITSGRGIYTRSFSHYEPMPKDLEKKVIEEAARAKEKEDEG